MVYTPVPAVFAVRVTPVVGDLAVMMAFGIAAPEGSRTVPTICPVSVCATVKTAPSVKTTTHPSNRLIGDIRVSFHASPPNANGGGQLTFSGAAASTGNCPTQRDH